jgi:hypothetical protein
VNAVSIRYVPEATPPETCPVIARAFVVEMLPFNVPDNVALIAKLPPEVTG